MAIAGPNMLFNKAIFLHAAAAPRKLAMALADRSVTYEMVASGIIAAEERLREIGLTKTDLVAIQIDNPIIHLMVISALYRAGIVSVSIEAPDALTASGLAASVILTDSTTPIESPVNVVTLDQGWFSAGNTQAAEQHELSRLPNYTIIGDDRPRETIGTDAKDFDAANLH